MVVQRLPLLLFWQQSASPLAVITRAAVSASNTVGLVSDVSQFTARLLIATAKAEVARMAKEIRVRENIVELDGLAR